MSFINYFKPKTRARLLKGELDHIIPINHPLVSGLSVPWNIQIITAKQNSVKGNKWNPNQSDIIELFGEFI